MHALSIVRGLPRFLIISAAVFASAGAHAVAISVTPASPLEVPFSSVEVNDGVWTGTVETLDIDVNGDGSIDVALDNVLRIDRYYRLIEEIDEEHTNDTGLYRRSWYQTISSTTGEVDFTVYSLGESSDFRFTDTTVYLYEELYEDWWYCDGRTNMCDGYTEDDTYGEFYYEYGPGGGRGFVAFSFDERGDTHFGWIDLAVSSGSTIVYGWGWETQANSPIGAGLGSPPPVPVPASIWLLISGLAGLLGIRARRPGQISAVRG